MSINHISIPRLAMVSLLLALSACVDIHGPSGLTPPNIKNGASSSMPATTIQTIPLWDGAPPAQNPADAFPPFMECHLARTETPRGAVIVLPGGGYSGRADYEGGPIAQRFVEEGMHGFVVQYRVAPHRYPAALMDVAQAIRIVRSRAEEWKVDPNKIAVLGFSAGGHLAGSISVLHKEALLPADQPLAEVSCRPDALVLCYAVASSGPFGHQGSFDALLGPDATPEMRAKLSLENQVTPDTPPTFLWHTADDQAVPVENCLLFASALSRDKVPFELHVYPHGPHGMAIAANDTHVATWSALCSEWLEGMGW